MSATTDGPTRFTRLVLPGAFMAASIFLLAEVFGSDELVMELTIAGLVAGPMLVGFALLASLALGLATIVDPQRRARLLREAALVPCMLAPLAVVAPWVLAPSHFGVAQGSLPFFLSWVDRYPTVVGINHEVLLGIGALLGASALPALLAAHVSTAPRPSLRIVALLALLQLVAYVPVLVHLDGELLLYGALVTRDGPFTIFGPTDAAWWQNAAFGLSVGAGALMRLAATAVMLAMIPVSVLGKERTNVWEGS